MPPKVWVVVLLLWLGMLYSRPAVGQTSGDVADDFLILQVRLRSHVLAEAMPAFQQGERVFLPLGEFAAALEFAIQVDSEAGTARGWALDEEHFFGLDTGGVVAEVVGRRLPYDPDLVLLEPDDLYVATALLEQWFPLYLILDLPNLQVVVESTQPLPLERRLERERRRERALAGRQSLERPEYRQVGAPHSWLSWPFADLSVDATRRRDADGSGHWDYDQSLLATADLLKMTGEVFAAGDQRDGLSDLQLRLGRRDPQGSALGLPGVTEFVAGDVFSPPSPLVARSVRGRGAVVSSFPLDRPDEFDRTIIRGPAPPRWEAELQRDGVLLDFQIVGNDGMYEFADVPVLFGRNEFEVVLYGPQGQARRVPYPFYVGPGLIEPGVGHLRLSLNQQETDLVDMGDSAQVDGPAQGDFRLLLDWERGLNQRFSLAASVASLPIEEEGGVRRHDYLGVGGRFTLGPVYAALNGVWDTSGGGALQGAAQGRWLDANWSAEHGQFWGFRSERVENGDPVRARTQLGTEWGASAMLPFSVGLELRRETRRSGRTTHGLSNRLSFGAGPVLVTNRVTWQRFTGAGTEQDDSDQAQGALLLSTVGRGVLVRGELGYGLSPIGELRNTALAVDGSAAPLGGFRFRCGYAFDADQTTVSLGWNRSFAAVAVGVDGEYRDDGTFAAGVSATLSFGRDPAGGRWVARAEPMAAKASAAVRVLLDRDGNGQSGPGDESLEGVRFQINGRTVDETATDERGEAFLPCLPAYRLVDITVEESSLEDPYWVVAPHGQRVLVRPGATPVLEFLVVDTGEIEGTVYVRRDEDVREQPRVTLQLLDAQGQVTQEVESAFDGFFLFQRVPLGAYSVRGDPAQLRGAGLEPGEPVAVDLTLAEPVAAGVDFVLEESED